MYPLCTLKYNIMTNLTIIYFRRHHIYYIIVFYCLTNLLTKKQLLLYCWYLLNLLNLERVGHLEETISPWHLLLRFVLGHLIICLVVMTCNTIAV
jgi:hypothetical protein